MKALSFAVLSLLVACSSSPEANPDAGNTPVNNSGLDINEISAMGEDWVELFNTTNAEISLANFALTDTAADGTKNLLQALRFDSAANIPAGGYVVVMGGAMTAGPTTTCTMTGPASCYAAVWKVSASRGESVWLLTSANEVLQEAAYPANAVLAGQTYARLPDGTGGFAAGSPTPAAANQAP